MYRNGTLSKNYVPKWYVPKVICTDMDLPHSDDIYILVKTVTIVVTTPVSDSTIWFYTSVVTVNLLQVYTLRCYYWR